MRTVWKESKGACKNEEVETVVPHVFSLLFSCKTRHHPNVFKRFTFFHCSSFNKEVFCAVTIVVVALFSPFAVGLCRFFFLFIGYALCCVRVCKPVLQWFFTVFTGFFSSINFMNTHSAQAYWVGVGILSAVGVYILLVCLRARSCARHAAAFFLAVFS